MSPPQKVPSHHRERKASGSSSSPSHSRTHHQQPLPVRRRLSASDLNKEPVAIPLVTKQSADSVHSSHPDPRILLSRLVGQKRMEFRAPVPAFAKDLIMPSGKLVGLKITLSSENDRGDVSNQDKRPDPRISSQNVRNKTVSDPRVKSKQNDPRLRMRSSSITKSSTPPHSNSSSTESKSSVPPKPIALLTKPASSIIPSLPELNLDLASIAESAKAKSPPQANSSEPLGRLPKLLRAGALPSAGNASNQKTPTSSDGSNAETKIATPAIAPYDPRYITAAASPVRSTVTSAGTWMISAYLRDSFSAVFSNLKMDRY